MFFFVWGWVVLCALDTLIWNLIFTIMNVVQTYIAYKTLPRKIRFPAVVENLYEKLFAPIKVSKEEFEIVYNTAREVQYLRTGELFEKKSHETVSLIIRGRISIIRDEKQVKELFQFDFVDPSTYFGLSELSDATLCAMDTDTIVLIWRLDDLKRLLDSDTHLKMIFDCLVTRQMMNWATKPNAEITSIPSSPVCKMVADSKDEDILEIEVNEIVNEVESADELVPGRESHV